VTLRLRLPNELDALLGGDDLRPEDGDNVGLWLDKYLRVRNCNDKGETRGKWSLEKEERVSELRRRVCRESLGRARTQCAPAAATAVARMREAVEPTDVAAALYGGKHRRISAQVVGRLLVDYGRASAHELSVSAHHVFGCPRIPGSALKGLTRAWVVQEHPSAFDVDNLFGSSPAADGEGPGARRGRLVFHDALPVAGEFKLATDVLTPHYGEYYRGKAPPAEWLSPVPHTFVTVVETTFEFVIGLLPGQGDFEDEEALGGVVKALGEALRIEGIGAKRAAGYGRMELKVMS